MMIRLAESGLLPDRLVRQGIRYLLGKRLRREQPCRSEQSQLLDTLSGGPVAVAQGEANEQHYEVDARFYSRILGRHLKYSSGYWPDGVDDLTAAEEAMLSLSCERAKLSDGQEVLELGCGWGSLSLWMADRYPHSRITAVSNSNSQRQWILARVSRCWTPLRVILIPTEQIMANEPFLAFTIVEQFGAGHEKHPPTL